MYVNISACISFRSTQRILVNVGELHRNLYREFNSVLLYGGITSPNTGTFKVYQVPK